MDETAPEIVDAYLKGYEELGFTRKREINGREQEGQSAAVGARCDLESRSRHLCRIVSRDPLFGHTW